jgi:hypothetical protein
VKKAVARLAPNDSFSYPERAACTGHPLLLPTRSNTAQKPAHLHSCVCSAWNVVVLRIISRRSAAPITENVADLEAGVYRTCSPMLSTEVEVGLRRLSVVRTWRSTIVVPGPRPITHMASSLPNLLEIWILDHDKQLDNSTDADSCTRLVAKIKTRYLSEQGRNFFVSSHSPNVLT